MYNLVTVVTTLLLEILATLQFSKKIAKLKISDFDTSASCILDA